MTRAKLIANPVSGNDSAAENIILINEKLRENFGFLDICLTLKAGDAEKMAEQAARDGIYEYIFAGGGDGTLNEVINGIAKVEGAFERIVVGLIPLGTGNDFADALGLSEDIETALDTLNKKQIKAVDFGKVNDHFFINVSAGGFIAEVSDAVNPQLKSFAGKLAYLLGGAQVIMNYEPVKTKISFTNENGQERAEEAEVQMFAVCNSRLVGGGRQIAPDAIIDDGLFDVCIVKSMSTVEFLGLLTTFQSGTHVENENVEYFRAKSVELNFERETKANADGEVFDATRLIYKIYPRKIRLLVGDAPFSKEGAQLEKLVQTQ